MKSSGEVRANISSPTPRGRPGKFDGWAMAGPRTQTFIKSALRPSLYTCDNGWPYEGSIKEIESYKLKALVALMNMGVGLEGEPAGNPFNWQPKGVKKTHLFTEKILKYLFHVMNNLRLFMLILLTYLYLILNYKIYGDIFCISIIRFC